MAVQSLPIAPYNDALQGFRSVCRARLYKVTGPDLKEGEIAAMVRKSRPDLILAIGMDALVKLKSIKDVPILYVMVLSPHEHLNNGENVSGVRMIISPMKQLSLIREAFPSIRKIGVFYDPAKSGRYLARAYNAASLLGMELVARKVQSSRDAVSDMGGLKGIVDALWLIPDTSVVTPATIDLILLSSIENKIPILTFSEKYAEKGALFSLEVDPSDAGRQCGEMANRVLGGANIRNIPDEDARSGNLSINLLIARKLGVEVNDSSLSRARTIR